MKHYYAFNWTNGVGALDSKTGLPIGVLQNSMRLSQQNKRLTKFIKA